MARDVREAAKLLLWARRNRFALARVKIGEVEIEVAADLEIVPSAPSLANTPPTDDPYEKYGGAALQRFREQTHAEGERASALVEEDDDDEPTPVPGS